MKEITLALISELRERTGLGMMDCKRALVETEGDVNKAIEILRKKGALVAEKRSGNKTSQGLIHSYIHSGAQIGVLLEINCETDFVARNDLMKQFANDICMHIAAIKPLCIASSDLDQELVNKEKDIQRAKLENEKKPAAILEKILEGKMSKYYSEVCLMNQQFIKNDQLTVEEYLKEIMIKMGENVRIRHFVRFEIGL